MAMLPIIVAIFALLGYYAGPKLAMWHFDVRTAVLLVAEEEKLTEAFGTYPETRAVMQIHKDNTDVYRQAAERYKRFRMAGLGLGCWVGAVLGLTFILLMTRRRRTEYEVDPGRCVACGRCFWYCPNQKENRVLLEVEQ